MPLVLAVLGALAALLALMLVPGFCGSQLLENRNLVERPARTPSLLVPVAHLASLREDVKKDELSKMPKLAVPKSLDAEVGELLDRPDGFRGFDSSAKVVDHVSRTPDAIGLVPWDAVSPRVKALSVDGEALIGPEGADPEKYPLKVGDTAGPDPKELRRIVVAGDIVLDRGQSYMAIQQGRGLDFALAGGYAGITSRTPEESEFSEFGVIHQFTAERRTAGGEVKEFLNGADLTLANLENPVKSDAVYHPDGTEFHGDLRLLPIVTNAGVDGVTLGNNHILDAGPEGLGETLEHLDDADIRHAGAGPNLATAREPMIFNLGGVKVGVLSYQGVPTYDWSWATGVAPGTAPMVEDMIVEDVKRLRPEVDLLLVMPHWGDEYTATPEPGQVELAHGIIDAGADLIVGGHAHWPKGVEMYRGKRIFYGTGNFLMDQAWSEETSTGIFVEITLYKDRIVQTRPVPFVILDYAQPNFLVPEAGGDRALKTLFSASLGPEFEPYKTD